MAEEKQGKVTVGDLPRYERLRVASQLRILLNPPPESWPSRHPECC